jgi:endonuclease/exonuclease/phosphatase (EEP) superfamily protein YafD
MEPFRNLLTNGYDDSARQAGAGRELTYPANERIPSFMGIDHILTRDCTAVSTQTATVKGSDHRALLATVMVPTG